MTSNLLGQAAQECACHQWYDMDEVGRWPHSLAGARASQPKSVQDIVATEPIWDRSELSREELTARIAARGGIDHAYALTAMTFVDGRVSLDNGVHRWAVADELRIKRVPVEMSFEPPEPAWAWLAELSGLLTAGRLVRAAGGPVGCMSLLPLTDLE